MWGKSSNASQWEKCMKKLLSHIFPIEEFVIGLEMNIDSSVHVSECMK